MSTIPNDPNRPVVFHQDTKGTPDNFDPFTKPSSALDAHVEVPLPIEAQKPLSLGKNVVYISSFFCSAGAVSLIALTAFKNYNLSINALTMFGAGLLSIIPVVTILSKDHAISFKDLLLGEGQIFDLLLTQLDINLVKVAPLAQPILLGVMFFSQGLAWAGQGQTVIGDWTYKDDSTGNASINRPLLAKGETSDQDVYVGGHRIPTLCDSRTTRVALDILLGAAGAVAAFSEGFNSSDFLPVIQSLGRLAVGYASGAIVHEVLQVSLSYGERVWGDLSPTPKALKALRTLGIIEVATATIFIGVLGFKTPATDLIAGMLTGALCRSKKLNFTLSPVHEQTGLQKDSIDPAIARNRKIIHLFAATIWTGFAIWQGVVGDAYGRAALTAFTVSAALFYALGKWMDRYDVMNGKNHFKNEAFFWLYYFNMPPIVFIAITGMLKIGSRSVSGYTLMELVVACAAWTDLARAFGTEMARTETTRDRRIPTNMNTLYTTRSGVFLAEAIKPLLIG